MLNTVGFGDLMVNKVSVNSGRQMDLKNKTEM